MVMFLIWMFLALFGSTQSVPIQCQYIIGSWSSFGTIYYCTVLNTLNITTLDTATVDSVSGTHLAGYNNDNVEGFQINQKGVVNFFPRGLNKFFKNIKKLQVFNSNIKEIHRSDLREFPKLEQIWLQYGQLEILEANLFEFNPNLTAILLNVNKIIHVEPTAFNNLTKLNTLWLDSNPCIKITVINNATGVQNLIKTAQAQCINSDYAILETKVKNLEIDSVNLNSDNLKIKLDSLETEVNNSKYANFFQERLQALRALLVEKVRFENIMCSAMEAKINILNDKMVAQDIKISAIQDKLNQIIDMINNI